MAETLRTRTTLPIERPRLPLEALKPSTNGHLPYRNGRGVGAVGDGGRSQYDTHQRMLYLLEVFVSTGSNWLKTELIVCKEWQVGHECFAKWRTRAGKFMKERAQIKAEEIVSADKDLYERSLKSKNYPVCSQINTRLAKMAGLYTVHHVVEQTTTVLDPTVQKALVEVQRPCLVEALPEAPNE